MFESITGLGVCQQTLVDPRFPWRRRKIKTFKLSRLYELGGNQRDADRAAGCSTNLQYQFDHDTGERRLFFANFCYLRLCPICSVRRSIKIRYQLSSVLDYFQSNNTDYQYIFVTLTQRNVPGCLLGLQLNLMQAAWHRFVRHFKRDTSFSGWFKSLEITYNSKTREYHPHYHVVFAVPSTYFHDDTYFDHNSWRYRWKRAMRLNYDPLVRVQAPYVKIDGKLVRYMASTMGASVDFCDQVRRKVVQELGKYPVKDADYLKSSLSEADAVEVVRTLTAALHGRRLMSFGGCLRQAALDLKVSLDDVDGDLVHLGDEEPLRPDLALMIEQYGWDLGASQYLLTDKFVIE